MTTLRPFGPYVAFTAAAMRLIPVNRLDLASSSNFNCFGMGSRFLPYSRIARTSSSRMIRYSLSSIFTSEPEYFPKRILSPVLTSSGIFLPSSLTLPLPAAITLASCGFSLAVSGMMIPPFLTSFSSSRSTRMRSCNGRIFMCLLPPFIQAHLERVIPAGHPVPACRPHEWSEPPQLCAVAADRVMPDLFRSGLQKRGCARFSDFTIGTLAPRHSRPAGFGHELLLVVRRRERLEFSQLFQPGAIGLRLRDAEWHQP